MCVWGGGAIDRYFTEFSEGCKNNSIALFHCIILFINIKMLPVKPLIQLSSKFRLASQNLNGDLIYMKSALFCLISMNT